MFMYMDMYIDPEEEDELWTILLDENLMSVMMSMLLDRMKMEEQTKIANNVKTESKLDANPECDVASDNPTPELTEQLAEEKTGSEIDDASNVKVGKPPGTKKQLTWLKSMWAVVPQNIREWPKNMITSPRAWGEDNARKWRQIVDNATKRLLDLGTQNNVDSASGISSELSEIRQSASHECD